MSTVRTRIDNRLIHGQIVEAWVPHLQVGCIVVANDKIANSAMQKLLMEASVPKGIRVFIGSVDDVFERFTTRRIYADRLADRVAFDHATQTAASGVSCAEVSRGETRDESAAVAVASSVVAGASGGQRWRSDESRPGHYSEFAGH